MSLISSLSFDLIVAGVLTDWMLKCPLSFSAPDSLSLFLADCNQVACKRGSDCQADLSYVYPTVAAAAAG